MSPEDKEGAEAQQQSAVTALAPLYVPACPGSGKTHVIVARHVTHPAGHFRQARALISFTRTARNQMGERCRAEGRAELAAFPNFIGTMDSFLWEFLVRPYLSADRQWQLVDMWAALGAEVKLDRTVALAEFPFVIDPDNSQERISQERLRENNPGLINSSKYPWGTWAGAAWKVRDRLVDQGYLSCHENRLYAFRHLTTRPSEVLGPLRSRFSEIMVDEVQDCSAVEIAILGMLHDAGVKLTLVGDPDQMIYEWRDADRQRLDEFTAKFDTKIELTGNRHSTPTICALAATLRSGSRPPDISVAGHDDDLPVLLMPAVFKKKAVAECRFGKRRARGLLRAGDDPCWHSPRELSHHGAEQGHAADHAVAARREPDHPPCEGLGAGELRQRRRSRRCAGLPCRCLDASEVLVSRHLRQRGGHRQKAASPGPRPPPTGLCLPRSSHATACALEQRHQRADQKLAATRDRYTTSHQGALQRGPTLLLLPTSGVGARWRDGDPAYDEELRILYVAVTRARRLVGLAMPEGEVSIVRTVLTAARVPHHVIGPAESLKLVSSI
ncbi:DEAD/DEAH box helicase [Nonomuraea sp. NPDC046802]|uniref:DEAD/DEAH box helicase n=1 Tax=Nonomuraea sp. NPDC046802 TaxID=3154919 RepID=UPI0033FADDAA